MKVDWNDVKEDYARKDAEIDNLKKLIGWLYIEISGKKTHSSDCKVNDAPALIPERCDCEEGE